MILDTFCNIQSYESFSEDIFKGLVFLKDANSNISKGIYKINNRVSAIVEEYQTSFQNEFDFESHKNVIDIQYPIIGLERVLWSPLDDMKIKTPYDSENDCTYYTNPHTQATQVDIGNEIFAIFFENDGHSPKHCSIRPEFIKKITIKVRIDRF